MAFRCPVCGRYIKGRGIGVNQESGTCKKCKIVYRVEFWHYIDESGEPVCGTTILERTPGGVL